MPTVPLDLLIREFHNQQELGQKALDPDKFRGTEVLGSNIAIRVLINITGFFMLQKSRAKMTLKQHHLGLSEFECVK